MSAVRSSKLADLPAFESGPFGVDLRHIGVSTAPGQMQFDVSYKGASTLRRMRVTLTTPALLAA